MTDLTRHFDTSYQARMNRLEKKFRRHHVDIQRLWKDCAPLGDGIAQGGGPAFSPPFDEPPSGGTALTGTPCKNRYCVSRYAGSCSQISAGSTSAWTNVSNAAGSPDGNGARVSLPSNIPPNSPSYVLTGESFSFTIPEDATIVSLKLFAVARMVDTNTPFLSSNRYLQLNGVNLHTFVSPSLPHPFLNTEFLEHLVGQAGSVASPTQINSAGFGGALTIGASPFGNPTICEIDSLRIEVCYDLYTLSGTCSENPG